MALARRHSSAAADYDGHNPLRLAEKIDAALDKYGLGKRTPPVERELLATMTQQCRVRYQLRRPIWVAWQHQLDQVKARPRGLPMEMQHDHNCGGKAPGP
jgi:hypothetical protein